MFTELLTAYFIVKIFLYEIDNTITSIYTERQVHVHVHVILMVVQSWVGGMIIIVHESFCV